VLFFLDLATLVVVIVAWFAILVTGRYPRGMFGFVDPAAGGPGSGRIPKLLD